MQKAVKQSKTSKSSAIKPSTAPAAVAPAKSRTLLEISEEYSELEVLLELAGGEVTPENEKLIEEYFAKLGPERDKKIEGYCGYIRDLEYRAKARADESKRIAALGKTDENRAKYLGGKLLNFMKLHKFQNIETLRYKITRAENASAPVELDQEFADHPEKLEERFRTTKTTANLTEIAQALKDGEKLPFARFGQKGENLRIK